MARLSGDGSSAALIPSLSWPVTSSVVSKPRYVTSSDAFYLLLYPVLLGGTLCTV